MLIADDQRRYVGVNQAMCLLLRSERETVLQMRVEDLTAPELRGKVPRLWKSFLRKGVQSGPYELLMPDGLRMSVEYSATTNVVPGRHLSIFVVPPTASFSVPEQRGTRPLSVREREVLSMVAMGENGQTIARVLGITPATVESHVRNCLAKLEAKNRAHAIALGIRRGEISLDLGSQVT